MAKKNSKKPASNKKASKSLELKVKKMRELGAEDLHKVVGGFVPTTGTDCYYTDGCY